MSSVQLLILGTSGNDGHALAQYFMSSQISSGDVSWSNDDVYHRTCLCTVGEKSINLQIYSIARRNFDKSVVKFLMATSDAFIITYNAEDVNCLCKLEHTRQRILLERATQTHHPISVVGMRHGCREEHVWFSTSDVAVTVCWEWKCIYREISSKNWNFVDRIVEDIMKVFLKKTDWNQQQETQNDLKRLASCGFPI